MVPHNEQHLAAWAFGCRTRLASEAGGQPPRSQRAFGVSVLTSPGPLSTSKVSVALAFRRGQSAMKYAVIRTGGKQYLVAPGDVIRVEKLAGEVGSPLEFAEVLLAADDGDVQVGQPLVMGFRVRGEIVAQGKAKKVVVFKKKRRKNYRRQHGHRQEVTSVKVTGIEEAGSDDGTQEGTG